MPAFAGIFVCTSCTTLSAEHRRLQCCFSIAFVTAPVAPCDAVCFPSRFTTKERMETHEPELENPERVAGCTIERNGETVVLRATTRSPFWMLVSLPAALLLAILPCGIAYGMLSNPHGWFGKSMSWKDVAQLSVILLIASAMLAVSLAFAWAFFMATFGSTRLEIKPGSCVMSQGFPGWRRRRVIEWTPEAPPTAEMSEVQLGGRTVNLPTIRGDTTHHFGHNLSDARKHWLVGMLTRLLRDPQVSTSTASTQQRT